MLKPSNNNTWCDSDVCGKMSYCGLTEPAGMLENLVFHRRYQLVTSEGVCLVLLFVPVVVTFQENVSLPVQKNVSCLMKEGEP